MHIASRPLVYVAIMVLMVGFSFLTDVNNMAPRPDQVKPRCGWPAGETNYIPWYVEEVGGAEAERPEGQPFGRCVGIQAV